MGEPVHVRDIDLTDILEAIRKEASALGEQHGPPADAGRGDAEPSRTAPASPLATASARCVAPAQSRTSRIPTVAASQHVNTSAAARARGLAEARRHLSGAGIALGDEEATVSFVVRESRQG